MTVNRLFRNIFNSSRFKSFAILLAEEIGLAFWKKVVVGFAQCLFGRQTKEPLAGFVPQHKSSILRGLRKHSNRKMVYDAL